MCGNESVKGCMVDHIKFGLKLGNQVVFKMVIRSWKSLFTIIPPLLQNSFTKLLLPLNFFSLYFIDSLLNSNDVASSRNQRIIPNYALAYISF